MTGIALGRFKEKGYFVCLVIKGRVLPLNGFNLFDSFFLKGRPAVDAIQDDGGPGFIAVIDMGIIKDLLNLDGWKLRTCFKRFNVSTDCFLTF